MECILCDMWNRLPYARKHTTPTTPQETEGAMTIGFWLGTSCQKETAPLCERHALYLESLDKAKENKPVVEKPRVSLRKKDPMVALPVMPLMVAAEPEQPQITSEFKLGPGPLTNDNTITAQPPLPIVPNDLTAPYRNEPQKGIDPVQMALDAAKMPPVEGRKMEG